MVVRETFQPVSPRSDGWTRASSELTGEPAAKFPMPSRGVLHWRCRKRPKPSRKPSIDGPSAFSKLTRETGEADLLFQTRPERRQAGWLLDNNFNIRDGSEASNSSKYSLPSSVTCVIERRAPFSRIPKFVRTRPVTRRPSGSITVTCTDRFVGACAKTVDGPTPTATSRMHARRMRARRRDDRSWLSMALIVSKTLAKNKGGLGRLVQTRPCTSPPDIPTAKRK